ncbi:MAG: hypothetical protein COB90_06420 [Hyphomicrobiales bacterium]|nr:MAG: hypothetical protein COB90_06420 [Hyphomicrobiales bacterium]
MMNFQQVRFVLAVMKTGSFTKAAELCCVTQPALSNAVNQLEEEFGAPLFTRTTRLVEVTAMGKHLEKDFQNIVDSRLALYSSVSSWLSRDDNTLRMGLSPLVSSDIVERMMTCVKNKRPDTAFVLTELNRVDMEAALKSNTIDIAVGPAPLPGIGLHKTIVYAEPLLLVSAMPFADEGTQCSLDILERQQTLLVHDDCGLAQNVRSLFEENDLELKEYPGRALGYHVLEKWALLGIGHTLLPASKITNPRMSRGLIDRNNNPVMISYAASWAPSILAHPAWPVYRECFVSENAIN